VIITSKHWQNHDFLSWILSCSTLQFLMTSSWINKPIAAAIIAVIAVHLSAFTVGWNLISPLELRYWCVNSKNSVGEKKSLYYFKWTIVSATNPSGSIKLVAELKVKAEIIMVITATTILDAIMVALDLAAFCYLEYFIAAAQSDFAVTLDVLEHF